MIATLDALLGAAREGHYAVGAFNVYDLAGVKALVLGAEAERAPVILQLHEAAVEFGGLPLIALALDAAVRARVPICVHMDHIRSVDLVHVAAATGLTSVMADGSHLPFEANVAFVSEAVRAVRSAGLAVEAELGLLSGSEDGRTVESRKARLTDPAKAREFVERTGASALAVCIGNVHGAYREEPRLDFARLEVLRSEVTVPLVLHGASGLSATAVRHAIDLGICKFNVNTDLRKSYVAAIKNQTQSLETDLLDVLGAATAAMELVIREKVALFGSSLHA